MSALSGSAGNQVQQVKENSVILRSGVIDSSSGVVDVETFLATGDLVVKAFQSLERKIEEVSSKLSVRVGWVETFLTNYSLFLFEKIYLRRSKIAQTCTLESFQSIPC